MELLKQFRDYFICQKNNPSCLTVKNYLADIRQFIEWYQKLYKRDFDPGDISRLTLTRYKNASQLSLSSLQRHMSSLKKFAQFLYETNQIAFPPEKLFNPIKPIEEDFWHIKEFKDYLFSKGSSYLTIKNYIIDIQSFKIWCNDISDYHDTSIIPAIVSDSLVSEYKNRLLTILHLSPKTVNRKLSSIRGYISFAKEKKLISESNLQTTNISESHKQGISIDQISKIQSQAETPAYSQIPPVRLAQRLFRPYEMLEEKIATSVYKSIYKQKLQKASDLKNLKNVPKSFYAPHLISLNGFSLKQKLIHHLKHTRPKWYKEYHSVSFTHYFHLSILVIYSAALGFAIYQNLFSFEKKQLLAAQTQFPSKVLSFSGKLTSQSGLPITQPTDLRFSFYNDQEASGSSLLWQEVHSEVIPQTDGKFSVGLGIINPISEELLSHNSNIYIGITVDQGEELRPREKLISTSYAQDANLLQSMPPITQKGSGATNVILALDSSGNLIIENTSPRTFRTGGPFTLSGQPLILTTNPGSGENVVLAADGTGKVDLQSGVINSTDTGNISAGAVEIDDNLVVSSGTNDSTLIINKEGVKGDIFTASSSGISKFVISNGGYVGINTPNPSVELEVFGNMKVSGNVTVRGITYAFPLSDGQDGFILATNGSGQLSWVNIGARTFTESDSLIYPSHSDFDVAFGGNSTGSAKFAFTNLANGTPTARFNGNLVFTGGARTISSEGGNNLTFGDTNTGAILFSPGSIQTLAILPSGKVGIGTVTPNFKLELQDNQAATSVALISNTDTGSDADGLSIQLGYTGSGSSSNRFIAFLNGNGIAQGQIVATGSGVLYQTNGIDFAEYFRKENALEEMTPGTLVCLGKAGGATACDKEANQILGVVSEHPGFVGGGNHENDSSYVLIALVGQVPIKVGPGDGHIKPQDPLGISDLKGYAQKVKQASAIVGRALSQSTPQSDTVMVSLQPSWFDPLLSLSDQGTVELDTSEKGDYIVRHQSNTPIRTIQGFGKVIASQIRSGVMESENIIVHEGAHIGGTLLASVITAGHISTDTLTVATDNISIAGNSLRQYILQTVQENISGQSSDFYSPLARMPIINTNIISPLSRDSNISVAVDNNSVTIYSDREATGAAVASIDNSGNAQFSGNVTNNSLLVQNNATVAGVLATSSLQTDSASVSGTLRAGRIIAQDIEGLDSRIEALKDQEKQANLEETVNKLAIDIQSLPKDPAALPPFLKGENISAEFLTIEQGLTALGASTFNQVAVLGGLSIDTNFLLNEYSLNTIGHDLEIQPFKQGGVNIMAGALRIDTEGNLTARGAIVFENNLTVQGRLTASLISPLNDQDLVIDLENNGDKNIASNLIIKKGASNSALLSVNNRGDVIASGSGSFAKLKLNLIGQAHAISDTTASATGSAGTAILKAYKKELTIYNTNVGENSLIYVTPVSATQNQVLYLLRQVPDESFTVGIGNPTITDVKFNWIIVN